MNESGRGRVMESNDFFFVKFKNTKGFCLQANGSPVKKIPKFREPVQSKSLMEASIGHRCETNGMYCMSTERALHKLSNSSQHVQFYSFFSFLPALPARF